MKTDMHIRPARSDETTVLTDLAHAAKRHWGYPESWIEQWRAALTFTTGYLATHPTFVAEEGGAVAGVCALEIDGPDAHVEHLWVLPSALHRGVGRALFSHAEAHARTAGARTLHILSDPHAEGFYRKLGAQAHGLEPATMDGHVRHLVRLRKSLQAHLPA